MALLRRIGVGTVLVAGLMAPDVAGAQQDLSESIQASRMTVVEINRESRRMVCVNSLGRLSEHRVTNEAKVVTDNKTAADLALVNAGDIIKADLRAGRIQRIVVLRHAWIESASPEQ